MSENTREMLHSQLISQRETLDELWECYDEAVAADGDDMDARQELDESVLEIVWEKGEPFAVVLGTGGPHIEIRGGTRHDGAAYSLHGYWAGEHVEISGESITRTGEYFRELVEELDQ